jgi:oxalate decarboxylase
MRLAAGGTRELHWHKPDEWAFMLAGKARITALDQDGHNFVADVGPGDTWYFPSGIPHSIQGLSPEGTEFLLAFTDGGFSEDATFALTDMFPHFPPEVLAKNFGVDKSVFKNIPKHEKFIFPAAEPPALAEDIIKSPAGPLPANRNMSFGLGSMKPIQTAGGTARISDTTNFPISTNLAAALVEVQPGHLREIHWHPNADEWQYYISGQARMTVFAAQGIARTFDYLAGDAGYVPKSMPHYVENTGKEPLRFLELFRAPRFEDISLAQWMALTPHELVAAHLDIDRSFVDNINKNKVPII